MTAHDLPLRVYYEDTDAGGIVFYANYLKFAERGRTEFLRAAGYENRKLMEEEGVMFVVRRVEADYHKPAYLDDELVLRTAVEEIRNSSFAMKQSIFKDNILLFAMDVLMVCVNKAGRPVRVSPALKAALTA